MNRKSHLRRRHLQQGLSLIELMVALVLGLFLAGMVGLTYLQSAGTAGFGALESQMNEDGALALELLRSQLKLAGYSDLNAGGQRLFRGLPIRGCDGGFTSQTESKDFDNLDCLGGAGSDALAVRYQATFLNVPAIEDKTATPPIRPGNCANAGMTATRIDGKDVYLADNRFYIADDGTNGNAPTLYCRGSDGMSRMAASAIVPNVERMRLRYAITRLPQLDQALPHQVTALVDASALPNDEWTRVAAVELCIIMRTARPVPRDGLSAAEVARYLDCDGKADTTSTDGRLRRAYRAVVQLPNLRPALPSPHTKDNGVVANPYAQFMAEQTGAGANSSGNTAEKNDVVKAVTP